MTSPGDSATEPADYAALNLLFATALGGLAVTAERSSGWREPLSGAELVPLSAATFALAKLLARERIGSWVREPFVEDFEGGRRPRGRRLRYAVGELLTCTRCVGAWGALSLVGLRLTVPHAGRTVSAVLATSALNDFLQAAFRVLTETSTQIEQSG